jgi:hypothetical protein
MTYTKPEIREIGSAAELIQGGVNSGADIGQTYPPKLSLEDIEE